MQYLFVGVQIEDLFIQDSIVVKLGPEYGRVLNQFLLATCIKI
jgi:hypothetical protein